MDSSYINELSKIQTDFLEEIIAVADKYKEDRKETFEAAVNIINFNGYKTEKAASDESH